MRIFWKRILPLVAFLGGYFFFGRNIYIATAALMIGATLGYLVTRFIYQHKSYLELILLMAVLVFGGLTLFLHDALFIKIKLTIMSYIAAVGCFVTLYLPKGPPIQALGNSFFKKHKLEIAQYRVLQAIWGVYFLTLGTLNWVFLALFNERIWVLFKIFGGIPLIILLVGAQILYIRKIKKPEEV